MTTDTTPSSYKCVHRATVPGSCHSRCRNSSAHVVGNPHGIRNGWFLWPIDYDPAWLEACDGFSDNPADFDPKSEADPMMSLLAMLRRR